MRRRDFLSWGLGGTLAASASRLTAQTPAPSPAPSPSPAPPAPLPALPRVNGGINVQPLRLLEPGAHTSPVIIPELVDLQLEALYELGFESLRITISYSSFGPDFFAAIPYVRAARALGIEVLGVMTDFSGFDLVQALRQRTSRDAVVNAYLALFAPVPVPAPGVTQAGRFALQVLNEPTHSLGIAPEAYVREFLTPSYDALKQRMPELTVVAAAEVGNSDGVLRLRAMLEAGLEQHCDRVACHIYDRKVIPLLSGMAGRPVWVTESGVLGPQNHLGWVTGAFDEIRGGIAGVERIFYYQLYDTQARGFRILEIVPDGAGFRSLVESPALYDHLAQRVRDAAGSGPAASYRELIPDIRAYFPTQDDLDRVSAAVGARG